MPWITYITEGYQKRENETILIGVFHSKSDAIKELIKKLIDGEYCLSYLDGDYDDYDEEEKKEFKIWSDLVEGIKTDNIEYTQKLLDQVIGFCNSWYQDGWDYTLKHVKILLNNEDNYEKMEKQIEEFNCKPGGKIYEKAKKDFYS
mgnify:CR=1 FL=1